MIEWLNQHVGADAATYLGTFLAVVALVYGGSKFVKRVQKQNVKNGNGIQAGGNVTINVNSKEN
ncbi:hypothetical protein OL318_004581 [Vibrio parahaemolyticus]|nr:hypothetical protein [Vibrio parahaemolyticus]EKA7394234.1 hypothetical protein [Vibrio parahaemolyticus]HAS8321834.1 hypothetical protein [Vibrio vulnificus]HAS8474918.1 hypothetical protein [Vibrio vulnificus]